MKQIRVIILTILTTINNSSVFKMCEIYIYQPVDKAQFEDSVVTLVNHKHLFFS